MDTKGKKQTKEEIAAEEQKKAMTLYYDSRAEKLNGRGVFNDKVLILPDIPKGITDSGIVLLHNTNTFDAPEAYKETLKTMVDSEIVSGIVICMGIRANKVEGFEELDTYARVSYMNRVYDYILVEGIPYMIMRVTDLYGFAENMTFKQFEAQRKIRSDYEADMYKSIDFKSLRKYY